MATRSRLVAGKQARLTHAATQGRKAAAKAVRRRAAIRRVQRETQPVAMARRRARAPAGQLIPRRTMRALAGPPPAGLLVAEGDSWFDYPFNDILSKLEDEHGFDVQAVAHLGDTVENMAYGDDQFDDFTRLLEKLLKQGRVPDAILISGGGNDIAGGEFAMLLNHVLSGLPPVNADVLHGVVDVRIRNAYTFLIAGLTQIAQDYLGQPIPILLHGYDYAVPDGRGVLGGWAFLPGPWLRPSLHRKGHKNLSSNKAIIATLIDALNAMLQQVAAWPPFGHVKYVNLRGTLKTGANYQDDWANEIHPTADGFSAVAAKIAAAV